MSKSTEELYAAHMIHNQAYANKESHRKIHQKEELIYCLKQRLSGLIMLFLGIVTPFLLDGDITFSCLAIPIGIFLLLTREKIMIY